MKKNAGFTLIELVVGIAIAAIVLSAVSAVVLMGLHNNRVINQAVTVQNDSRVITQLLQNLTSRGSITGIVRLGENCVIQGTDEGDQPITLLTYSGADRALKSSDGLVLMDNVDKFEATIGGDDDQPPEDDQPQISQILTLSITADGETYKRSIYCRTQKFTRDTTEIQLTNGAEPQTIESETITLVEDEEAEDPLPAVDLSDTVANRREFLKLLATQYGSTGTIQYGDGTDTGISFAAWYSNGAWSDETPWCACFVSWAAYFAHQVGLINEAPSFAWVPNGIAYFKDPSNNASWHDRIEGAQPGDYIFFNTDVDADSDHVGVVLYTDGSTIITIEGNTSGQVGLRRYDMYNPNILGYGVLDWAPDAG